MCKILLKFNQLQENELENHREKCDSGNGICYLGFDNTIRVIKQLKFENIISNYNSIKSESTPFLLFHSRLPSVGTVNIRNVQPFTNGDRFFCHNGHIFGRDIFSTAIAAGTDFKSKDSDSRTLWSILLIRNYYTGVEYLKTINQNFVYGSLSENKIAIVGDMDFDIEDKQIKKVHNNNRIADSFILTNLSGRIEKFDQEKSPWYALRNNKFDYGENVFINEGGKLVRKKEKRDKCLPRWGELHY